jgi:hypothetical protein
MKEQVTIIKGPIPSIPQGFLQWENLYHVIYSVSLNNGLIITNPDQFPEQPSINIKAIPPIDESASNP